METGNKRRVKVYELSSEGQWIDKGTGQVSHQYVEIKDAICIVVRSEDDGTVLLNSKIRKEDIYHRQQSTLIVWTEQSGLDLALSFQEADGCNELWWVDFSIFQSKASKRNIIADVQKKLNLVNGVTDIDNLPSSAESSDDINGSSDDFKTLGSMTLIKPTHGNLREVEQVILSASRSVFGREQLAQLISQENYIDKLLVLLTDLEDLESLEDLYTLSSIMKMIIFLNDSTIYETILQDAVFLSVVGVLEYDKEFPNTKANHRSYLIDHAHFKEVIPIKNPEIVQKIKQTYRIQFLKDVALARLLDDTTFSALNSLVFFNHMDIIGYFQQDNDYLEGLFRILTSEEYSEEKKKEVVLFLHEICSIAKNLQVTTRASFYRALGNHGLFAIFEYTLADSDVSIRLAATAILWSILEHDPAMIRSFCVAQIRQESTPLIDFIISRFLNETDSGIKSQFVDIIRVLLDTSGTDMGDAGMGHAGNDSDSEEFLNKFYEIYMAKLSEPILKLDPEDYKSSEIMYLSEQLASTCSHICELLCFAIKQHSYRSKYYILGCKIIQKTVLLLRAKDSYVRLSALRVFRVCIGMKDEFYNRHLIKIDVFGPILVAFRATKGRYNLLNSACLDLFEFIRKENIKGVIASVVQSHRELFEDVDYVDTFKLLVLRHEQNSETPGAASNGSAEALALERKELDGWSRVDHDEEAYFEGNEDDEGMSDAMQAQRARARSAMALSLGAGVGLNDTTAPTMPPTPHPPSGPITPPPFSPLVNYPDEEDDVNAKAATTAGVIQPSSPPKLNGPKVKRGRDEEEGGGVVGREESHSPEANVPVLGVSGAVGGRGIDGAEGPGVEGVSNGGGMKRQKLS
ncbi:Platinum sensitivity protein [Dinochytrium kinnereticum]|nr:Platinum sensitivity protein [Dinochytrium kinnereticum]